MKRLFTILLLLLIQGNIFSKNLDVIIVFKSNLSWKNANYISSKEAKGKFVFEQLQAQTKNQNEVQQFFKANNIFFESFWIINAIRVVADEHIIAQLATFKNIEKIVPNSSFTYSKPIATVQQRTLEATDILAATWGINKIEADSVWTLGIKGQGAVVAGQDTGYDFEHPAIFEQYRGNTDGNIDHNYNWHDAIHSKTPNNPDSNNPCGYNSMQPCDDGQHGTHTMGTCVGLDSINDKIIGVAPKAKWIGCRNMDRGDGLLSTYVECFQFFLAPTDTANLNPNTDLAPDVINNSWGCPISEGCNSTNFSVMESVVDALVAAGIVVVVSNGNSGSACRTTSDAAAFFKNSFSVGATNGTDVVAGFSSRGNVTYNGNTYTKPDISAPGVSVMSCVPGGGYNSFSGTSMAGPHVAGLVALIISANPDLRGDVAQIIDIIKSTAKKIYTNETCGGDNNTSYPNNTYGYGRIDALAAVQEAIRRKTTLSINDEKQLISNNFFTDLIFFKEQVINQRFNIYDNKGDLIKSEIVNGVSWNLSQLPKGVYFINTIIKNKAIAQRIVKL